MNDVLLGVALGFASSLQFFFEEIKKIAHTLVRTF